MRNLTIKRIKSFVGCAVKMKVYIEDPVCGELTINNIPCRKIGDMKNGEEKTFQIEDREAKVFVIADTLSKDYCNDFYQLPEGQEDIYLSGKNKFNPAGGNAFRFDNNESADVLANRKRGSRVGIIVMIVAVIVGAIAGFLISSGLLSIIAPEPKTFSSSGMTITLTDAFWETDSANYTITYDSEDVAVFALKEDFSLVDGFEDYTIQQYADLVIQANELDSSKAETENGLTHFEYTYTNPETNDNLHYYSYVYKSKDAFWCVQFAILEENVGTLGPQITEWAKSVKFSDSVNM